MGIFSENENVLIDDDPRFNRIECSECGKIVGYQKKALFANNIADSTLSLICPICALNKKTKERHGKL
jgi:hypothetical protein